MTAAVDQAIVDGANLLADMIGQAVDDKPFVLVTLGNVGDRQAIDLLSNLAGGGADALKLLETAVTYLRAAPAAEPGEFRVVDLDALAGAEREVTP